MKSFWGTLLLIVIVILATIGIIFLFRHEELAENLAILSGGFLIGWMLGSIVTRYTEN